MSDKRQIVSTASSQIIKETVQMFLRDAAKAEAMLAEAKPAVAVLVG